MSKSKNIILWVVAVVFMVVIAIYQRSTGPTYPEKGKVDVGGTTVEFSLPRSFGDPGDCPVTVVNEDRSIIGKMKYKRFKSHDEWSIVDMERRGDSLVAYIPSQPPAGKVQYEVLLGKQDDLLKSITKNDVVMRYKGYVPTYFLIPHVLAMFLAMVFSTRAALEVLFKGSKVFKLALWTTILFFIGGFMLGPIIQWYAFGDFWTGLPFGTDLTDNKTLISFVTWLLALWRLKRHPEQTWWALIAAGVLLAIYLIPHSVLGSELDFTTETPTPTNKF
ncbi:MAG: hypothetical protein KGZ71_09100 [Desulfobulbaceae bacterium]|nr:hypothetical protein [Candidatus Kapabacteria bacterium]MBS4000626.1 hypothetical protein [Desulfobulbaceae bacterium]